MIGVGSIEKDFVVENESILTTSIFFVTGKTFEDGDCKNIYKQIKL